MRSEHSEQKAVRSEMRRMKRFGKREALLGFLFAMPWILGFLLLTAFPLFYSLYLSFTNATTSSTTETFKGFANYKAIVTDANFWLSVKNTIFFVLLSVPLNLLFSLLLALLLHAKVLGRKMFRALYYIPTLVTIVAVVYLWPL